MNYNLEYIFLNSSRTFFCPRLFRTSFHCPEYLMVTSSRLSEENAKTYLCISFPNFVHNNGDD